MIHAQQKYVSGLPRPLQQWPESRRDRLRKSNASFRTSSRHDVRSGFMFSRPKSTNGCNCVQPPEAGDCRNIIFHATTVKRTEEKWYDLIMWYCTTRSDYKTIIHYMVRSSCKATLKVDAGGDRQRRRYFDSIKDWTNTNITYICQLHPIGLLGGSKHVQLLQLSIPLQRLHYSSDPLATGQPWWNKETHEHAEVSDIAK